MIFPTSSICPVQVLAHWLLLNVAFNYYMGTTVFPGSPPQVRTDAPADLRPNTNRPATGDSAHLAMMGKEGSCAMPML